MALDIKRHWQPKKQANLVKPCDLKKALLITFADRKLHLTNISQPAMAAA